MELGLSATALVLLAAAFLAWGVGRWYLGRKVQPFTVVNNLIMFWIYYYYIDLLLLLLLFVIVPRVETGAAGSVGRAVLPQLLRTGPPQGPHLRLVY